MLRAWSGCSRKIASSSGHQWPSILGVGYASQQWRTSASSPATTLIQTTDIPSPHTGHIRVLSLNRPRARNAISRQLLAELRQHVIGLRQEGDQGSTRAVVLASEVDECFCAGADLKERAGFSQEETTGFLSSLRDTLAQMADMPIPTISAVSSVALGGGLELALTTDFRVFASTVQVGLPETRLGIIPGAGGTYRLPALVGPTRAMDLILTGRRVGGAEAFVIGLCDRLVEINAQEQTTPGVARDLVLQAALALAREICEGAPLAIRAAKKSVRGWQVRESENMAYDEILPTEDRLEALQAFREKRRPVFKGR
ncbi:MAG: hypothetical protein M1823_002299 [Watsoniomyces obsoletus]|nr:MAG: hypothetical protein M1823_002299 [Watsoniomyces obsoletus]